MVRLAEHWMGISLIQGHMSKHFEYFDSFNVKLNRFFQNILKAVAIIFVG